MASEEFPDVFGMLYECDQGDPTDDVSESDEEYIPRRDISESEDNVEVSSEENDVATDEFDDGCYEADELVAKTGRKWSNSPPPATRRRIYNIVKGFPGPTQATNVANTILDVFNLFFDDLILDTICKFTNAEATRVIADHNARSTADHMKIWTYVDPVEMRAFFGVLLIAGCLRCRKEKISEMWSTDENFRRAIFTAAMARNRFVHIFQFIRFDDKTSRAERRKVDKLAAIRDVWDRFVRNCRSSFEPFEDITVDEQLVAFRGRCPMKQYMKTKPARYGIKIWAAADVRTSYLYNMQVYTGKPPGNRREKNLGHRVVCDLMEPLYGTGRGVTTDNFFTSVSTAEFLLKKNITMTGTLRTKKADIPKVMEIAKGREVYSSRFIFSESVTVVSYVPKRNKTVRVLSTQYVDHSVSEDDDKKPTMILEYNRTKGGVDNADKLIREYSCSRRTSRWPMRLFMNMLDIGALNAFIIWIFKHKDWNHRRSNRRYLFLLDLGKELTKPNILRRADNPAGLQLNTLRAIESTGAAVRISTTKGTAASSKQEQFYKRGRCAYCPRRIDRKVNVACDRCNRYVCEAHRDTSTIVTCAKNCGRDDD